VEQRDVQQWVVPGAGLPHARTCSNGTDWVLDCTLQGRADTRQIAWWTAEQRDVQQLDGLGDGRRAAIGWWTVERSDVQQRVKPGAGLLDTGTCSNETAWVVDS
jgi:hypothetical protein